MYATTIKQVTSVQCTKIKKKPDNPEFILKVTWSDSTTNERMRNYSNISDFLRILSIISPETESLFPILRDSQKFLKNGKNPLRSDKNKTHLDLFFQNLFAILPYKVLVDDRFISFFEITSVNELKATFSKILENAKQHDITPRSKHDCSSVKAWRDKPDTPEEKYSSLKLFPDNLCSAPETYQLPEDFLAKKQPLVEANMPHYQEINNDLQINVSNSSKKPFDDYWVIMDFTKRRFDEINVETGQMVEVLEKKPNGQYLVFNKQTKEKGWIPKRILIPQKETIFNESDDMEFVAIESYSAVNYDEITIAKGDKLRVLSSSSMGWWKIKVDDKTGKVPGSCIGLVGKPFKPNTDGNDDFNCNNKLMAYKNIEELYAKVEKLGIEKKKNGNVEKLPSYENIPKLLNDVYDKEQQITKKNRAISSLYAVPADILETGEMRISLNNLKKIKKNDSRHSDIPMNIRSKESISSYDEKKRQNPSEVIRQSSSRRLSSPSVYYNLSSNHTCNHNDNDDDNDDVDGYDDNDDNKAYDDLYDTVRDMKTGNNIKFREDKHSSNSKFKNETSNVNSKGDVKYINGSINSSKQDHTSTTSKILKRTPPPDPTNSFTKLPHNLCPQPSVLPQTPFKPALLVKPRTNLKQFPLKPTSQPPPPPPATSSDTTTSTKPINLSLPLKPKPILPMKPKDKQLRKEIETDTGEQKYKVYDVNKAKAENLLKLGIRGAFMFRTTSREKEAAILSVYDGTKVRHLCITKDDDGELCIGNCNFHSLPEVVGYFKINPIARDANGDQLKLSKHLHCQ